MGVGEKTAGRRQGLTARRLTPSLHCPAPCKILPEGEEKTPYYRLPSCSWPGARYAVTEVGLARPILASWHPAMERVTCRGGDRTALRNTSRVFFSALIRCCSVALILWVSSRFHYLCLCLADAGCISILLNPGWAGLSVVPSPAAEFGDIPSHHGFKMISFKRGQESHSYCKAQAGEVKRGSGDAGV